MSDFAEIYERIKMGTHRRTQVELACVLGIRQSSISDAKRRNSVPGDWFMKLFEKFGLSPDWLKYSVGPMYLRTEQGYMPADAPTSLAESTAYDGEDMTHGVIHTVYDAKCVYSDDAPRPALVLVGKILLPHSLIHSGLLVLRVRSINMTPLILEGAYVGVDTIDTDIVSGRVYAVFAPNEGVVLYRVFLNATQDGWVLRSEAASFSEIHLPHGQFAKRMIGRVTWVLQEI